MHPHQSDKEGETIMKMKWIVGLFVMCLCTGGCVREKLQVPEKDTDHEVPDFLVFTGETRATSPLGISSTDNKVERILVQVNDEAGYRAFDLSGKYEESGDLWKFTVPVRTNSELRNLLQSDKKITIVGFANKNLNAGINTADWQHGEVVQEYDFTPLAVRRETENIDGWRAKYRYAKLGADRFNESINGIYSFGKDILNVGNARNINLEYYQSSSRSYHINRLTYFGDWSTDLGRNIRRYQYNSDEKNWYDGDDNWKIYKIASWLSLQNSVSYLENRSHMRNLYYGQINYAVNGAEGDGRAYKNGLVYQTFPLKPVFTRLIINLKVKEGWNINNFTIYQIPQYFRIDRVLTNQVLDFKWVDNTTNQGAGLGRMFSEEAMAFYSDDDKFATAMNKSSQAGAGQKMPEGLERSETHPKNLPVVAMMADITTDVRNNISRYRSDAYQKVIDMYIPPFEVNTDTKNLRKGVSRGLSMPYYPALTVKGSKPGGGTFSASDIHLGALQRERLGRDINSLQELLKYPSQMKAGHIYVVNIAVGFSSDVEIQTYDATDYKRHTLEVSYGETTSEIKNLY